MTPVVPSAVNESFNGKPQASFLNFAYAYGSPLNEKRSIHSGFEPLSVLPAV
jgi:hypothetical protein